MKVWRRYIVVGVVITGAFLTGTVLAGTGSDVVGRAGSIEVSRGELDRRLTNARAAIDRQLHTYAVQVIEEMIQERLLAAEAAKRKVSIAELMRQEVDAKRRTISDAEVDEFIQMNQGRMKPGADVRPRVREMLEKRARDARQQEFLSAVKTQAKVEVLLPVPAPPRVDIGLGSGIARGAADATVTIVEFSDFQCPYCKAAQATLKRISEEYGSRVRFVFRDLPLPDLHPQAPKAAEAARCAGEQGKFWEYHDVLFANQDKLQPPDLVRHAGELGLAAARFEECLSTSRHAPAVERDIADARSVGITSTPTFFVNGLLLSGAHPFETFKKLIDGELDRKRPRS